MNWQQVKGNWHELKGTAKSRWGRLTDDDLTRIDGERERLIGKIQEAYGVSKEEAERQVEEFHWH